ncbi:hypothetical protein SeMB42_g00185 [Synchytrium endobioticum]|uniref:Uncharacterized protein n=1 Tax=Synchytrium endobioticum TaxID=286115 RepID=A0A507DTW8_9FUNG|nr:hypothetical protein SeMB42_g00185 [Synchytrium endobioticum]
MRMQTHSHRSTNNPALGQQHNESTASQLAALAIEASSQYLLMQKRQQIDQTMCIIAHDTVSRPSRCSRAGER